MKKTWRNYKSLPSLVFWGVFLRTTIQLYAQQARHLGLPITIIIDTEIE